VIAADSDPMAASAGQSNNDGNEGARGLGDLVASFLDQLEDPKIITSMLDQLGDANNRTLTDSSCKSMKTFSVVQHPPPTSLAKEGV